MSYSLKGTCNVCARERDLYVCCSSIGAASFAYCDACLMQGAEPPFVFPYFLQCSGPDPEAYFGPDVLHQKTYLDRDYVAFGDWLKTVDVAAVCKQLDDEYDEYARNNPMPNTVNDAAPFDF